MIYKFLKKILVFTLFATLFYGTMIIVSGLIVPQALTPNINYRIGSYGHLFTRINEIKNYKNIDILFLGSSHTYRGFDTRIFKQNGFTSFNLGSSSQTPIQTNILLKRYLKSLNPKIVIYDVYPDGIESDGVESSVDLIANSKNDLLSLKMALNIGNIKTYNTFLYGYFRDLFNLNKNFTEKKSKDNDTYISGGYVEKKITNEKPYVENKPINWEINKKQVIAFENNIKMLKQNNIKVILVQTPYLTYNNYLNNDSINSYYKSFNIPYYNFNEILKLPNKYYYDYSHLNQKGVKVFNLKLVSIMNKRY